MFCPECGHPLENESIKFCPNCGSKIVPPAVVEPAVPKPTPEKPRTSKRSTAALLFGAGTFVFAVFALICRVLEVDLRLLGSVATVAFFFAPLACCFGVLGIVARVQQKKRGLPSAIAGLLLGFIFGLLSAYLLLGRILGVALPF